MQAQRDILQRIEKLERENKRLKHTGFVVLLLIGVLLSAGLENVPKQTTLSQKIATDQISVQNSEGVTVARLKASANGGALILNDSDGNTRIELKVTKNGPQLVLDAKRSSENEAAQEGTVVLKDWNGNVATELHVQGGSGNASLTFYDENGNEESELDHDRLLVHGPNPSISLVYLGRGGDGNGTLTVMNKNGNMTGYDHVHD